MNLEAISVLLFLLAILEKVAALDPPFSPYHYSGCLADAANIHKESFQQLSYPKDYAANPLITTICSPDFELPLVAEDVNKYLLDPSLVYKPEHAVKTKDIVPLVFELVGKYYFKMPKQIQGVQTPTTKLIEKALENYPVALKDLGWMFKHFYFYDSLQSLKCGAPYSQSCVNISNWPLCGLRDVIVKQVGRDAYLSVLQAGLIPGEKVALRQFLETELHYQINLIYRCIGRLTTNFVYMDHSFTLCLANRFMGLLGNVLNEEEFSKNPMCQNLPIFLQLKLKNQITAAKREIEDKLFKGADSFSASVIVVAMKGITDNMLLEEIVRYVGLSLPDDCLTRADICNGLRRLKTSKLARVWVFLIAIASVIGVCALVVVAYRFVPFESIFSKITQSVTKTKAN